MIANQLREKSKSDLATLLDERRSRLGELSFLAAQRKIKNVRERSAVRRDIARILTVMKEEEIHYA